MFKNVGVDVLCVCMYFEFFGLSNCLVNKIYWWEEMMMIKNWRVWNCVVFYFFCEIVVGREF